MARSHTIEKGLILLSIDELPAVSEHERLIHRHTKPILVGAPGLDLLVERLYKTGYRYPKAGVTVSRLAKQDEVQLPLFSAVPDREREQAIMEAMDRINRERGRETLQVASSGRVRSWERRREHLSPVWTTSWEALPEAAVEEG